MKTLAAITLLAAVGLVAPAQATKAAHPGKPDVATRPAHPAKRDGMCVPHAVGFNASGTLVSAALTPAEPGRYDGTLVVNVTRTNHGAPTGVQTYTLTNVQVIFHDGVDAAAPAAGSRVRLHGKVTKLAKRCPVGTFTPTVKRADIRVAKTAEPKPDTPES